MIKMAATCSALLFTLLLLSHVYGPAYRHCSFNVSQDSRSRFVGKILVFGNGYQPILKVSALAWSSNLMSASEFRFVAFSGNASLAFFRRQMLQKKIIFCSGKVHFKWDVNF